MASKLTIHYSVDNCGDGSAPQWRYKMKSELKVGNMVRVITDEAAAVMPGTILEIGLIEIVGDERIYYLHHGDDWGFREQDIELARMVG